jgi:transposase IS66-like protein
MPTGRAASRTPYPLATRRSERCAGWLSAESHGYFAGSERGAERAALVYTLIQTAKLNDVDPQAWLADALARIADTPQTRLAELLPWKWGPERAHKEAA